MKNKSLGKNALYNIIYKVLNVIFPLISTAYISRVLLADGVGKISAVNNNVSYFLILATLGIPVYGLRETAKSKKNLIKRSNLYIELIILNFMFTIITYIIFNIIIFNNTYFRKDLLLYEIFGLTILLNIINVDWFFQGMEEYGYIATRSIIIKFLSILALFLFVKNKNDIYAYAIIQTIATCGNYILNIIKARSYINIKFNNLNIKRHIKPLIYLALCSVSTELYAKMDITMLDILKTSDVVGSYTNSQKIINLLITTLVAVTAVFMPRLSYLFEKDKNGFNKILKTGFDLMVTISIPTCIGLIIVSKTFVKLFLGTDFSNSAITVSILSLMIPLKCIGDLICYQVIMCASQEALLMKSYFITMIINLINNFILIPRFGAEGAACASVISEVLAFIFVLHYSKKYFKIDNVKILLIKTLTCTGIMSICIIPINIYISSDFIKLILQIFIGVLVYLTACIVTKQEAVITYISIVKNKIKR